MKNLQISYPEKSEDHGVFFNVFSVMFLTKEIHSHSLIL